MKTAQSLCASLVSSRHFRPLSQHRCIRMFLEMLPPRFRQAIAFVTVKESRLMVGLAHPGFKMELNYNQDLLKSLLTTLRAHHPECAFMQAEEIVIFHSRYHRREASRIPETVPRYPERAKGRFEAQVEDPAVAEILERIRRQIQSRGEER